MRAGSAIVLVIALVCVLGVFGATMRILAHGSYRELDLVDAHLRAVLVGEAAFARVVARLSAVPWPRRWFAGAADVQVGQAAAGGKYDHVLRDAPVRLPGVGLNQADLLVEATYERSTVMMYWRLLIPDGSVDSLRRVVPVYFAFPADQPAATQPAADALGRRVEQLVRLRTDNRPRFDRLRPPLIAATGAADIGAALGVPAGDVLDEVLPPAGTGPGLPHGRYLPQARTTPAPMPDDPPNPPPPTPLPTSLRRPVLRPPPLVTPRPTPTGTPAPTATPTSTPTPTPTVTPTPTPTGALTREEFINRIRTMRTVLTYIMCMRGFPRLGGSAEIGTRAEAALRALNATHMPVAGLPAGSIVPAQYMRTMEQAEAAVDAAEEVVGGDVLAYRNSTRAGNACY